MEIALYEAKNKLSSLIDSVVKGGEVTITRRGKAVARLMPVEDRFDRVAVANAIDAFLAIRDNAAPGAALGGLSVRELKNEGRP